MKKIWITILIALSISSSSVSAGLCCGTIEKSLFSFVRPTRSVVGVGQNLRVSFKLRRKAYVYLIAVSSRNNKAYMILPNQLQHYNRYRANRHYVIPERGAAYRFISDRPGIETLYVVASTHKQNFETLLRSFGDKEVEGFRVGTAKAAEHFMKDILIAPARSHHGRIEVHKLQYRVW